MDRLLTVRELAERLGISAGTAYHWLSQGRLPCVRFSSRCVRFRESDVQKMLEQLGQANVRDDSTRTQR
jgi:excisionase family DNA binding protein